MDGTTAIEREKPRGNVQLQWLRCSMGMSENGLCIAPNRTIFGGNMIIYQWIFGVSPFQTKPNDVQICDFCQYFIIEIAFFQNSRSCVMLCQFLFQTPRKDLWWMGKKKGQEARNACRESVSKTVLTSSCHIKYPNQQGMHWACRFFFKATHGMNGCQLRPER